MPLIILCGYPGSGKTHRAKQLVAYLESNATSLAKQRDALATASSTTGPTVNSTLDQGYTLNRSSHEVKDLSSIDTTSRAHRRYRVHHISDHSLYLRRDVYGTAKLEKDARAALYSAVKRVLSKDDVVVLDSGNYIKGWRYQLHCEAKAVGTASCVVHVGTSLAKAREIELERRKHSAGQTVEPSVGGNSEQDPYGEQLLEELLMRFEEPNAMARWDTPLFTVVWEDEEPPCERIWKDVVLDLRSDGGRSIIRPNQATVLVCDYEARISTAPTAPDHLYELDKATQSVVNRIQEYQRDHVGEGGGTLLISHGSHNNFHDIEPVIGAKQIAEQLHSLRIEMPALPISFAQLQRLRRQFISLHRQQMGGTGIGGGGSSGTELIAPQFTELFVDWLNDIFGRL